jgi:hypothetical protein
MPSEKSLSSDDRDREDAPEIMERRALEEILYVILCFFSTNFIINKEDLFPSNDSKELWWGYQDKNPPVSFPRTTRKGHGNDAKGRSPLVGGY